MRGREGQGGQSMGEKVRRKTNLGFLVRGTELFKVRLEILLLRPQAHLG